MRKIFFLLPFFLFGFSSCSLLAELGNMMCELAPDTDHCRQFTAVQSGDADACSKIKWTKFKDTGSNPPRDKCYLQVAINKKDFDVCGRIQGGPMSYTKDWCVGDVGNKILGEAVEKDDIGWCLSLKKYPAKYAECTGKLATPEKIKSRDSKIDDIIESLKKNPDDTKLKKELDTLKKDKQERYLAMTDAQRASYFSEKREAIMSEVEDEDVKSSISKEYTKYREWEKDINKLLEKLQDITTKQEMIKKIDEDANQLTDTIKEQLEWIVGDKQDEIVWAMGESAKDWIEKNGGDKLKWSLKEMEWAMGKYEKWSEMYESMKWKYDKLKWAYDEVMGVYNRVDQVNKMLAEGKIDTWKAKVLKWAVLLDKWLEYATWYVPVFWSTISTISKETFGTVIEVAKKRAERSTAIEKCFDDPANCDTDSISGY